MEELELRQQAVIYVWVHSHTGIVPNEAIDLVTDELCEDEFVLEPPNLPPRHSLARIEGIKKGVGQFTLDFFEAVLAAEMCSTVQLSLLANESVWAPFLGSPVKMLFMREAEFDVVIDARENRAGLHADLKVNDWVNVKRTFGAKAAQHAIDMQPERGGFTWYKARCTPCPCCAKGHRWGKGVCEWEHPCFVQSRWHVLTECSLDAMVMGDAASLKEAAIAWLTDNVVTFDTPQARWALTSLRGRGDELNGAQRFQALRFMLGLPETPRDASLGEKEASMRLSEGYGRGFFSRIARILRAAKLAAVHDLSGWSTTSTFGCRRWRILARDSRKAWVAKRGPQERWMGHKWVRKCFSALRQWCIRGGPQGQVFWLSEVNGASRFNRLLAYSALAGESGERSDPQSADDAERQWAMVESWLRWRRAAGSQGGSLAVLGIRTAKALVHLRAAGYNARDDAGRREVLAAQDAAEVLRCLNKTLDKVVSLETKEATRGSKIWGGMINRLFTASVKIKRPGVSSQGCKRAAVGLAIEEGVRPVRLGCNVWKVERILSVRRLRVGGVQALVRWAGEHPDTWEPLTSFAGDGLRPGIIGIHSMRRRIERLANAVLGSAPRKSTQRPARSRTQPSRSTEGVSLFKRLVRGIDARVGYFGGKLRLVSTGTSAQRDGRYEQGEDELGGLFRDIRPGVAGDGPRIHVTIVCDDDDETDTLRVAGSPYLRIDNRKRAAERDKVETRKSSRLAEDPGGAGRLKRRLSATLGRRVKRRTI